jgi:hypothetical protein
MDAWKVTGFGPDHVSRWFVDGELFDARRPSVLTAVWLVALVTCVASAWRGQNARAARAVLLASAASVALSVSGGLLHDLGRPGAFVLSFLQPLRVLCLVPVVAAALIAAALEVLGDALAKLPEGYGTRRLVVAILWLRRTGLAPLVLAVPVVALACVALPDRLRWVHEWRQSLAAVEASSRACAALDYVPAPGAGPWWRRLEGGRLWHDAESTNGLTCAVGAGFEVASTVPLAATSAVGTHVGVHAVAFRQLHPERPGSALRAEALGIRHALVDDQSASRDDGWEVVARSAPYALLARRGGTGLVGVGCVESALYGADAEVRDLLFATLPTAQGAAHFLDPTHLVALRADAGPTREEPVELDGCDATSAKVTESPAEPGRFDAQVESASPVDVVLRATAFPSWGVRVDGQPASIRTLAVGFFSVRVAAGAHHVEATVAPLPDYGVGLVIALLGTVALSTPWSLRRRLPHA